MHVRLVPQEVLEILGVRCEQDGRRAIAHGRRPDERVDSVIRLRREAQLACQARGGLAGRLQCGSRSFEDREDTVDLGIAGAVAGR